jgi:hypothetical protein
MEGRELGCMSNPRYEHLHLRHRRDHGQLHRHLSLRYRLRPLPPRGGERPARDSIISRLVDQHECPGPARQLASLLRKRRLPHVEEIRLLRQEVFPSPDRPHLHQPRLEITLISLQRTLRTPLLYRALVVDA